DLKVSSSSPGARSWPSLTAIASAMLNLSSTVRILAWWTMRSAGPLAGAAVTNTAASSRQGGRQRVMGFLREGGRRHHHTRPPGGGQMRFALRTPGPSPEHDEAGDGTDAAVDRQHLLGRLHHRRQGDGDVAA